jgi:ankyrin repeat protein
MLSPDIPFTVSNDSTCAEMLISLGGADPNRSSTDGSTPLILAATSGLANVIDFLLRQSSVNLSSVREDGDTAEMVAEREGHAHIAIMIHRELSRRGALGPARTGLVRAVLHARLECNLWVTKSYGST